MSFNKKLLMFTYGKSIIIIVIYNLDLSLNFFKIYPL